MRSILWGVAATLVITATADCQEDPRPGLSVLAEDYPRVFFFRRAEAIYEPYAAWEASFSRLMGIEGKALGEEIPARSIGNAQFFSRFKQNHPHQLVLLHFNGNSRDPRFDAEAFFAGHWLYHNGAVVLSDVAAEAGVTEIAVSDASLFETGIGRFQNSTDDIGLCELDTQGQPRWLAAEQVELVSIDTAANTIRVRRGCFGTRPRSFQAGRSYAAAHVGSGPWGGGDCRLMWFYNFSTAGPRDPRGRSCVDVLVEDIARRFGPQGPLAAFDGIEFDVMSQHLGTHLFAKQYYRPGSRRAPDTNADGKSDDGEFHGVNTYGAGLLEMLTQLRARLGPEKLLLADGNSHNQQRAFGILNGIECEGWPFANDVDCDAWSWGMNRLLFWRENSVSPPLNYINLKWAPELRAAGAIPSRANRLVMAVACLTDAALALHEFPGPDADRSYPEIWDEVKGSPDGGPGWLGRPRGPTLRLARQTENLLAGESLRQLAARIEPSGNGPLEIALEDGAIVIRNRAPRPVSSKFTFRGLPNPRRELTVFLEVSVEPSDHRPLGQTHLLRVRPKVSGPPGSGSWHLTWVNRQPFTAVFYYPSLAEGPVTLHASIEASEVLRLYRIEVYAHPDALAREFAHGVVLANPSPLPYRLELDTLFPGQHFRRIDGSATQDRLTNSGAATAATVEVPAKDGLFLVKVDP